MELGTIYTFQKGIQQMKKGLEDKTKALEEMSAQKDKYANNIRKLETKCTDYEFQIRKITRKLEMNKTATAKSPSDSDPVINDTVAAQNNPEALAEASQNCKDEIVKLQEENKMLTEQMKLCRCSVNSQSIQNTSDSLRNEDCVEGAESKPMEKQSTGDAEDREHMQLNSMTETDGVTDQNGNTQKQSGAVKSVKQNQTITKGGILFSSLEVTKPIFTGSFISPPTSTITQHSTLYDSKCKTKSSVESSTDYFRSPSNNSQNRSPRLLKSNTKPEHHSSFHTHRPSFLRNRANVVKKSHQMFPVNYNPAREPQQKDRANISSTSSSQGSVSSTSYRSPFRSNRGFRGKPL